ncbi:MAG TPA: hypothetical protein VKO20_00025, partial [Desulfosalsimonadaceae bacterium]|nr:hypothetical protein [Desulfosalsimonadaceae bacterium]
MEINTKFIPREPGLFLVGGTVRDALLGGEPTDFDIAAAPPCGAVARRIAEKTGSRVAAIGKSGAYVYRIVAGNLRFDIAPIQGGSIEADLQRRDFTVNAMAWDLYRQKLLDPADGQTDLEKKYIRMLGENNLLADPLRMLRAYRLAAALGFRLERQTKTAIRRHARRITEAAGERIHDELMKMLACRRSLPWLREMDAAGLLTAIFPELQALKDCRQNNRHAFNAFSHTLEAFSHLENLLLAPEKTGT